MTRISLAMGLLVVVLAACLGAGAVKQRLWSKILVSRSVGAVVLGLCCTVPFSPVDAVSGGGKDFANLDLRDQDFSGQKLNGKDFTQCDATGANFKGTKLAGSRFYRALLVKTDFTGADLSGASLEDTTMTDAILESANMQGSYLSKSIADVKSLKGADLTDALMEGKVKKNLCLREDVAGTLTGESLFCE